MLVVLIPSLGVPSHRAQCHHEQREKKETEDQRPWTKLSKFQDLDSTVTLLDRWQQLRAQCMGIVL